MRCNSQERAGLCIQFVCAKVTQVFSGDQMYSKCETEQAWNYFESCPKGPGRVMKVQQRESVYSKPPEKQKLMRGNSWRKRVLHPYPKRGTQGTLQEPHKEECHHQTSAKARGRTQSHLTIDRPRKNFSALFSHP